MLEFESEVPTKNSDRVCTPILACADEEYEETKPRYDSDRACAPWSDPCSEGEYERTAPSGTDDRVCEPISVPCNEPVESGSSSGSGSSGDETTNLRALSSTLKLQHQLQVAIGSVNDAGPVPMTCCS